VEISKLKVFIEDFWSGEREETNSANFWIFEAGVEGRSMILGCKH